MTGPLTAADEAKLLTVQRLQKAIDSLDRIVRERCSGTEAFSSTEYARLREAYFQLIECRDAIAW